jgi:hypothetical protein
MTEETEVRSPEPMAVSLDLELLTLASATRGAEILADYQLRQGFMDEPSEQDAPESVCAILSLVGGRLEQLRRVVRGEEDPAHIWAAHNASTLTESLADFDGDIVLFAWKARGMPLVLARPSAWGVEPEEREERTAMGYEAVRQKGQKHPNGRKAKEPKRAKGRGTVDPVGVAPSDLGGPRWSPLRPLHRPRAWFRFPYKGGNREPPASL